MKTKIKNTKIVFDRSEKPHGTYTALITPFYKGQVDFKSLKKIVRYQIDNGIDGFVINGTTAESPTLNDNEVKEIFSFVKKQTDNNFPLILGTGTNSTAETIKKTLLIKKFKARAALVVVPYYNKPPQRGLVEHFNTVANSTKTPIILYNVPGRTITNLSSESILKLAQNKNIIGIKEASGELTKMVSIKSQVPNTFVWLSGDDGTTVDFCLAGGRGVISVVSHVIPKEFSNIVKRATLGDIRTKDDFSKFLGLNNLLGIESNPIPVKMALKLMGLIRSAELRLPLMSLDRVNTQKIERELKTLGII